MKIKQPSNKKHIGVNAFIKAIDQSSSKYPRQEVMERNMDESRKAFERFLREEHLYTDEELVWEDGRNCYSIYPVHIAWKSWQASRETIEIKLDDKVMVEDEFDKGHNCAIEYCAEAIRAAGIKVKE